MTVPIWVWILTIGVTLAMLLVDVVVVGRSPHVPSNKETGSALAVYVGAALAFGLLGTSVVQIIGTGLDTEFIVGVASPEVTTPSAAVMYNHWIGTIPWNLVLVGLSGLGLSASLALETYA